MSDTLYEWGAKCLIALIPVILAGLTSVAWTNSQNIGSVLVMLEHQQRELDHQRRVIDLRQLGCKE